MRRINQVSFVSEELMKAYLELEKGKFEDKKLFDFINRAIDDLKDDPFCGVRIPKRLWPKIYLEKYKVTNLWKYNLPNAWRLTYTLAGNDIKLVSMILE